MDKAMEIIRLESLAANINSHIEFLKTGKNSEECDGSLRFRKLDNYNEWAVERLSGDEWFIFGVGADPEEALASAVINASEVLDFVAAIREVYKS